MTGKLDGRLGLFPGTFDPIHLGHVEIARIAQTKMNFNAVIFIPNYIPPHKEFTNHASVFDRLCLVPLAILDLDRFYVSYFEVLQGGVSYTIHTIRYFKAAYPNCDLRLIRGGDNLRELHTWREIDDYADIVDIVGISRAGETINFDELKIPDELK